VYCHLGSNGCVSGVCCRQAHWTPCRLLLRCSVFLIAYLSPFVAIYHLLTPAGSFIEESVALCCCSSPCVAAGLSQSKPVTSTAAPCGCSSLWQYLASAARLSRACAASCQLHNARYTAVQPCLSVPAEVLLSASLACTHTLLVKTCIDFSYSQHLEQLAVLAAYPCHTPLQPRDACTDSRTSKHSCFDRSKLDHWPSSPGLYTPHTCRHGMYSCHSAAALPAAGGT
jgi:hypothetical protein